MRNVVTGGGRFGPGRLDGERAELQRRGAGRGVVAARGAAWGACAREEVPRGGPGGAKRFHAAAYGGRREQSRPGEREMEIRAYL